MILRNIKIALRLWASQPVVTIIKIVCLTLGIASTLVIAAYVNFERSYDKAFSGSENISRLTVQYQDDGRFVHSAKNFSPLVDILAHNIPSIEAMTRMFPENVYLSADGNDANKFRDQLCFVDSTFLKVFPLEIQEALEKNALSAPFSLVLTEAGALKLFGRATKVVGEKNSN